MYTHTMICRRHCERCSPRPVREAHFGLRVAVHEQERALQLLLVGIGRPRERGRHRGGDLRQRHGGHGRLWGPRRGDLPHTLAHRRSHPRRRRSRAGLHPAVFLSRTNPFQLTSDEFLTRISASYVRVVHEQAGCGGFIRHTALLHQLASAASMSLEERVSTPGTLVRAAVRSAKRCEQRWARACRARCACSSWGAHSIRKRASRSPSSRRLASSSSLDTCPHAC